MLGFRESKLLILNISRNQVILSQLMLIQRWSHGGLSWIMNSENMWEIIILMEFAQFVTSFI